MGPLMCHLLEELPTPVVVVFFFVCCAPYLLSSCIPRLMLMPQATPCPHLSPPWLRLRRSRGTCIVIVFDAASVSSLLCLSVSGYVRACVCECVCVSLPVSSLAASCLFLMCIFTDADFYFFAGCDISFSSSSVNRAALNVAP